MRYLLLTTLCLALSGCELFEERGQISLSVSATEPIETPDESAPERIVLQFSRAIFTNEDGETETLDLDEPLQVDLLDETDNTAARVFDELSLPAGEYKSLELTIDGEKGDASESFVELDDGSTIPLYVPDNQQSKLKLKLNGGIEIEDGETTELTVAIELRESLRRVDDDQYELHPAARLVRDNDVGAINGEVAASLIDGTCVPAVYIYDGNDAEPEDINGSSGGPVSTSRVVRSSNGLGSYSVAPLEPGDYTVALTCRADQEDPAENNDLQFVRQVDVEVEADETASADF